MRFTERPKWKRIALAVICLIGLLTLAGGSLAAYTSQAFMRGVAGNRDNETMRFTSNYLQSCAYSDNPDTSSFAGKTVLFSDTQKNESTSLSVDIYIYNYAYGGTTLISQRDITYDLKVILSGSGGSGYSVKRSDNINPSTSGNTYTFSNQKLIGRKENSLKYTVTFPGSDLDKLKITAVAKPKNPSVTNSQMLAAVIAPCTGSSAQTFTSSGELIYDSASLPTDYNGFNYEISISSGKANAILKWNADLLEIDRFFLQGLGKLDNDIVTIQANGQLNLTMDQSNGTGDYLIPFYIRDKKGIPDNWDIMKSELSFTATQITQDQTS